MYCSLLVLTKVTITLNYRDEAMHAAGNEQCLTFKTGYSDIIPSIATYNTDELGVNEMHDLFYNPGIAEMGRPSG